MNVPNNNLTKNYDISVLGRWREENREEIKKEGETKKIQDKILKYSRDDMAISMEHSLTAELAVAYPATTSCILNLYA